MLSKTKVLLSKSLLIIFLFLVLSFTSLNNLHSQTLQPNPDSIPFAPAVNYPVGDAPHGLFSADLNRDGTKDIIVTNIGDDDISILFGNGDGSFQPKFDIPLGDGPHDVWGGNLDTNGYIDLVVGNRFDSTVSVLLNLGNGMDYDRTDYFIGPTPGGIEAGDFDKDGDNDIVVVLDPGNSMTILWNNGDGTFSDILTNYPLWNAPQDVATFDCDVDSDLDLAISHNVLGHVVLIAVNDGFGNFDSMVVYSADWCRMLIVANLDSNEYPDLAVARENGNVVSVFKNNGDCSFTITNYPVATHPRSVFAADFDLDGNGDLASEGTWTTYVSILRNLGNGTFERVEDLRVGNTPYFTWAGDFDNDIDPDLAVINEGDDSVSVLINLVNTKPNSFTLLSPCDAESLGSPIEFDWQSALDFDSNDTVRYNLYLSRSVVFNPESTVVYDSLRDTTFTDSLNLKLWYWKVKAYDKWGAVRWSNQTWSFYVYLCGDCNTDGVVNIADVVYLINYLFIGGPASIPWKAGDVNVDGTVNIADVVYLINYLFAGGPLPCG